MAQRFIVFWRDIPAQVIVKAGRASAKRALPQRFIEAIDRAAMRAGLHGSDAYLDQWRRGDPLACGDDLDAEADRAAAAIEADVTDDVLKALAMNGGLRPRP